MIIFCYLLAGAIVLPLIWYFEPEPEPENSLVITRCEIVWVPVLFALWPLLLCVYLCMCAEYFWRTGRIGLRLKAWCDKPVFTIRPRRRGEKTVSASQK